MEKDITDLDDIRQFVDTFYEKVQQDELIGAIFNTVIQDKWPEHLAKMYTFWQTVLLDEHTYFGSPFPPHANLPIEQKHFNRWLELFEETVGELFSGEKSEKAKWQANRMATMFLSKINYYRSNNWKPLA